MRTITLVILLGVFPLLAPAGEPASQTPAKIRLAGIFLKGFAVWRNETPDCAPPTDKPWMKLDCGLMKCPKPQLLGIPLELDYSNWRNSPRMTEVEIDAGKPFAIRMGGAYVTASVSDAVAVITGGVATLHSTSCVYDLKFTPRAGALYEATIDPARGGGCFLRLSEIRASDTGIYQRAAIEGAELKACGG